MPRKSEAVEEPIVAEEWAAQERCPECGGRPGYDPSSGVKLLIRENGHVVEGHTYNCVKRPHGA
jgi:hypothetical protein